MKLHLTHTRIPVISFCADEKERLHGHASRASCGYWGGGTIPKSVKRRYYTINGERMSGKSVWLKYGRPDLSYGVFLQRVGKGWSLYDALQRQLNSHNPLTQQEPW